MGTDQGAAYILADRIINQGHILLVGPFTSLWQVNLLPPIYYYIVTFLYFFLRSELLVPLAFSIIGMISILFIYFLGKEMFDSKTGLITAFLYAISDTMVWYGRNMWEPHLVPFFIILSLLFLTLAKRRRKISYLYISIILFFLSFLYVSSILLLPTYYLLISMIYKNIKPFSKFPYIKTIIFFLIGGVLIYFPVIIFEATRGFPSLIYLFQVLAGKSDYIPYQSYSFFSSFTEHIFLFFRSIFIYTNQIQTQFMFIAYLVSASLFLIVNKKNRENLAILLIMFLTAFVLTGFYREKAEVYRLASVYPIIYLIAGYVIKNTLSNKTSKFKFVIPMQIILILVIITFIIMNARSLFSGIFSLKKQKYLHPYNVGREILNLSQGMSFTIYTITPDDKDNHHSTSYWWALERLTGERLIQLNNRGNWIEQELNQSKQLTYLICKKFDRMADIQNYCLNYFLTKVNIAHPTELITIDNTVIYSISNPSFESLE